MVRRTVAFHFVNPRSVLSISMITAISWLPPLISQFLIFTPFGYF